MKTIKVSDKAQQELKVFSAKVGYNMSVVASDAILQYIKEQKSKQSSKK
jgi:predicted transcriptional regulator